MAIPNWDALNVQHSRNIGDPVSSATTDGKIWTSAQRDSHLNQSVRRWIRKQKAVHNWESLSGYVTEDSKAMTANVVTRASFSGGIDFILSVYNSTAGVLCIKLPEELRHQSQSEYNGFLKASTKRQFWVEDAASIRNLGGAATDTLAVRYLKQHTALAANVGSTDIAVESQYWDQITDLAFKVAMEELPDQVMLAAGQIKEQEVEKGIAESAGTANR